MALARAIVIEPAILLLDEPLANLDAKLREEMRFFIRSLQQDVGITTVYVTHDQGEAMVMSDRIVVMFDGRVHQVGAPTEIYDRPASRQVASFIGQSNFIVPRCRAGKARISISWTPPLARFAPASPASLPSGSGVDLVLRPEAVELTREQAANGANVVQAELTERYFLGHTLACRLRTDDGSILTVQAPPWLDLDVGGRISCRFAPERTWLIPQ